MAERLAAEIRRRAGRYNDDSKPVHHVVQDMAAALDASPEPARAEPVAWKAGPGIFVREEDALAYCSDMMREDGPMPLYAAPHPPALPPGWVAVPVEPTEEMYQQGREVARSYLPKHGMLEATFRAMVKAAPPCPAVSLPDGFPWDAKTRQSMQRYLRAGFDAYSPISMDNLARVNALIRWLDQSPEQGGRSDG
jgi:hypothetical protein